MKNHLQVNYLPYMKFVILGFVSFASSLLFSQQLISDSSQLESGKGNEFKLVKYTARYVSGKVYVNWLTSSNSNDYTYYLERSVDDQHFDPICIKNGASLKAVSQLLYSYVDNNPLENNSFYRLRIINKLTNAIEDEAIAQINNTHFVEKTGSPMAIQ